MTALIAHEALRAPQSASRRPGPLGTRGDSPKALHGTRRGLPCPSRSDRIDVGVDGQGMALSATRSPRRTVCALERAALPADASQAFLAGSIGDRGR